jgi:hypothetical protein
VNVIPSFLKRVDRATSLQNLLSFFVVLFNLSDSVFNESGDRSDVEQTISGHSQKGGLNTGEFSLIGNLEVQLTAGRRPVVSRPHKGELSPHGCQMLTQTRRLNRLSI